MRGKLAIGITANFINNKTPAEERVPEISGVAYIFNQSFFKEMYAKTGVDLENIVYYKACCVIRFFLYLEIPLCCSSNYTL
ncbi:hypothetical protein NECAME_18891 [Necator americanus]|uniref:[F-actin]-monooxygenase MICAL1-3-like Rossman domain-containing protein n=1 Tax=Necator americanus TaxID=51031 RepID=W2SSA4_NECAM|nr:hypothetical protein NECAME_18891 [Necator americanus]ETN72378.1 hypothetical protein NECAME_18891 [Necator americanus]